jgi:CheY-like chemotaxis protein
MEESVPVAGGSESEPAPVRSVLVVDDEEPIRNAVRYTLQEAGYTVLEAPDGCVGLDLLRASDAPLVILLDLMMPGMSGIELLRAVAADPTMNPLMPISSSVPPARSQRPSSTSTSRASSCSTCPSPSTSTSSSPSWTRPRGRSNVSASSVPRSSVPRLRRAA